jgi:Leucine-rich repeat (LRR) protein
MSDSQNIFNTMVENGKAIVAGRCYINTPLSGEIDLSTLRDKNINELWFVKGTINQLYNFPDGLKKLVIKKNEISHIPVNELTNLAVLDAADNEIRDIDLSLIPSLTHVNLSHNKLINIGTLPPNLVELVVDHNPDLKMVDLDGAESCVKLSWRGKSKVNIHGASNRKCDIKLDDGAQIVNSPKRVSADVLYPDPTEAFEKYYELKAEYDASKKAGIKKIMMTAKLNRQERIKRSRQFVPKCVNCKRNGGTHFERKRDAVLVAYCGVATLPCDLKIEIRLGDNADQMETIQYFEDEAQKIKDEIVKLKLDTLFNYVPEEVSVKKFTELSNKLNNPVIAKQLTEYRQFFEQQQYNPEKNHLIKETMDGIYNKMADVRRIMIEYRKYGSNPTLMGDIGELLVEIDTDIKMVRRIKYPIMEMVAGAKNEQLLKQKTYEMTSFIEPEVVAFQYGNKQWQTEAQLEAQAQAEAHAAWIQAELDAVFLPSPDSVDESVDYDQQSPEYMGSPADYDQRSPEYMGSPTDYVKNSPEMAPYIVVGDSIEWNDDRYKSAWFNIPHYYRLKLLADPDWMHETLDSMVLSKENSLQDIRKPTKRIEIRPVDVVLPPDLQIPPTITSTGEMDFGNARINGLVNKFDEDQKRILLSDIQNEPIPDDGNSPRKYGLQPRTHEMTAEEKASFTNMLQQMLNSGLKY